MHDSPYFLKGGLPLRSLHEAMFSDFPADLQKVLAGFTDLQTRSGNRPEA